MKRKKVHSCNVLDLGSSEPRLWRFETNNGSVKLDADVPVTLGAPLPPRLAGKSWRSVFRTRLNVAWIPSDQLFLRVLQLPASDFTEMLSMLEFQIEKLSPLPVGQIVWSVESIPSRIPNMQTVVVVIVPRDVVEQFLGQLESAGYNPDRIEFPYIHQIVEPPAEENGLWLYPITEGGKRLCMAAWWFGGALQHLQLSHLTGENWQQRLEEEIRETAWAGEVEGWLATPFKWRLIAAADDRADWEALVAGWAHEPVTAELPQPKPDIARVSALKNARGETQGNLLPPEHAARYQQQFVDRLWMRGLGVALLVYLFGVLMYFVALQALKFQKSRVEGELASVSQSYTNALQLRERIAVMEDQKLLKFAALNCFRAAAEQLPEGMTLTSFGFGRGVRSQRLTLAGTVPQDQASKITDYNDALRKVISDGKPLFKEISAPQITTRAGMSGGGPMLAWSFYCDLNSMEAE